MDTITYNINVHYFSLLSPIQCDMVNIPYLRGPSESESFVAEDRTIQESVEDPELNQKLLQSITLDVARQLSGVPWQTFDDAQNALRNREKAVQDFIKMTVPLSHPEFTKKAMDSLLDKDVYFRLSPPQSDEWSSFYVWTRNSFPKDLMNTCGNKWNDNFSFNYRLGTKIQRLPPELLALMQRFVFGEHGQLTGYEANMSSAMALDLQLNQQTVSKTEVKRRFIGQQFCDLMHWIIKQSEAIDERTLVSVIYKV